MKKRFAKYIRLKHKINIDIIKSEDQVRSNPDSHIDQDFLGFPDAPSTEEMIDPKTKLEKINAAFDIEDGEKGT
jgi:hypothetical protein